MSGLTVERDPSGRAVNRSYMGRLHIPKGEWRIGFKGSGFYPHFHRLDDWLERGGYDVLRTLIFEALSDEQLGKLGLEVAQAVTEMPEINMSTDLQEGDVIRLVDATNLFRHESGELHTFIRYINYSGTGPSQMLVTRNISSGNEHDGIFRRRFEFVERPVR